MAAHSSQYFTVGPKPIVMGNAPEVLITHPFERLLLDRPLFCGRARLCPRLAIPRAAISGRSYVNSGVMERERLNQNALLGELVGGLGVDYHIPHFAPFPWRIGVADKPMAKAICWSWTKSAIISSTFWCLMWHSSTMMRLRRPAIRQAMAAVSPLARRERLMAGNQSVLPGEVSFLRLGPLHSKCLTPHLLCVPTICLD